MRKGFLKKAMTVAMATMMAASAFVLTSADVKAEEERVFDPSGATTYHAAMGIQTCTQVWINRQAYYDDTNNKYANDPEMFGKMWAADPSGDGKVYDGTFTDVEIKGNGTYTVKLEGADFGGETDISQLYIATDIPNNDKITVTDYKITINGKEFVTFKDDVEFETEKKYMVGGMNILCINHWRSELVDKLSSHGKDEDATSGYTLLTGAGNETIEMTFTVGGFDVDDPDAVVEEETEAPTEAETTAADTTTKAAETKSDSKDDKSGLPIGAIIGIVAGVVVVAGVIVVVVKKKK